MSYYQVGKEFFPTYNKAAKSLKKEGKYATSMIMEITITNTLTRPKQAIVTRWINGQKQENTNSQEETKNEGLTLEQPAI